MVAGRQEALALVTKALKPLQSVGATGLLRDALEAAERELAAPPYLVSGFALSAVPFGMSDWEPAIKEPRSGTEWLGPWEPRGFDGGMVLYARPFGQRGGAP